MLKPVQRLNKGLSKLLEMETNMQKTGLHLEHPSGLVQRKQPLHQREENQGEGRGLEEEGGSGLLL